MPGDGTEPNPFVRFAVKLATIVDGPVTYFREKIEPIQNKGRTPYYHRQLRRIPTVDECEVEDLVCQHEATWQFKRDKEVDGEILNILKQRRIECEWYHGPDAYPNNCQKVKDDYETGATNWFIKYGDMGVPGGARDAYMKQKNRMLWERRYGPVGTGMEKKSNTEE